LSGAKTTFEKVVPKQPLKKVVPKQPLKKVDFSKG
jgi:hypothetical protein